MTTRSSALRAQLRSPHAAPPLTCTEADFQQAVMDLAKLCGWMVVHVRPVKAMQRNGKVRHLTPYDGDPGLPDLILARNGVVLLVELKSETGSPTPEQRAWLAAAGPAGRLWKPRHWPEIRQTLRRAA